MKYIKKNKWNFIFEAVVLSSFLFSDPTSKTNFYCLLIIAVVQVISFHVHQKLNDDMTLTRELFDHEKNKTAIRIIQDLASEIVYPTKSQQWKDGLLDSVQTLKNEILRD